MVWARDRQGVYKDRLISKYRIEASVSGSGWEMLASSEDRLPDDPKKREKTMLSSLAEPAEKQEWEALSARLSDLNRELAAVQKLPAALFRDLRAARADPRA